MYSCGSPAAFERSASIINERPARALAATGGEGKGNGAVMQHPFCCGQAEVPVNWCPALGTVLANEEVIDGKSERGSHPVVRLPMKQARPTLPYPRRRLAAHLHLRVLASAAAGTEAHYVPFTSILTKRYPAKGTGS